MAVEKEVSYVITDEIMNRIVESPWFTAKESLTVVDYYLSPEVRIRSSHLAYPPTAMPSHTSYRMSLKSSVASAWR